MPLLPGATSAELQPGAVWRRRGRRLQGPGGAHDVVSLVSALVIAIGKIAISLLSAFAIVYFRFPFRNLCSGRSSSR
jgi:sn-glycerol 3-phosphate transport system permease protein